MMEENINICSDLEKGSISFHALSREKVELSVN